MILMNKVWRPFKIIYFIRKNPVQHTGTFSSFHSAKKATIHLVITMLATSKNVLSC